MLKVPSKLGLKPFTLKEAKKAGLTRHYFKKLISTGDIEQIARGAYRATRADISEEDQFQVATMRVGNPSAICLISALSHYGLIDHIPRKTWIMVPALKMSKHKDLKLLRTRDPKWSIGIKKEPGYSITTVERSIVDSLKYRALIGPQIGIEALKKALSAKKTDLSQIMEMAIRLKVDHRIRAYIEALS